MESESVTSPTFNEELKKLLPDRPAQVAWLALVAVFVWFYWSSIRHLLSTWYSSEDYQHGFFVPLFAVFLLWVRRDRIASFSGRGSWWGLAFFGLWALMRWAAVYYNYGTLPELSIIPFFLGVAIFVGGWRGLMWAWPSILFLIFMLPLPGAVQGLASQKLQSLATRLSVFTIQTLGIPAVAQGNVILLTDKPLEVARACSGLRMMTLFFALCIGAAFVTRRPVWEKLLIIVSAAPIAVISNVMRIVLTAVLYEAAAKWPSVIDLEASSKFIHDWAGFMMMPIGLALLLIETTLLSKLMIEPAGARPLVVSKRIVGQETTSAATRVFQRKRK